MSSITHIDVTSPFDGRKIGHVQAHHLSDVERMISDAVTMFKDRDLWLEHHERSTILTRLANLIRLQADDFATLIAQEGGKPLRDAKVEVERAINGIYLAVEEISKGLSGHEVPMGLTPASVGRRAFTTREPIGVVVAVSAFNHPLNLIVHQVVPAIASGCPVIVKPATTTPINCNRFVDLVQQAGLDPRWCQVCNAANRETSEALVTDERIAFFSFIGSAGVGWQLRSKLAPGVRCALEHGGVAPVIVDTSATMDRLIPALLKGGFYHAGQVCVSVQRVYVPETLMDDIVSRLADGAQSLTVGNPEDPDTEVGPLILEKEVDRVETWVTEAIKAGAVCAAGGKRISASLFEPTILVNPPEDAKVSTSEVFGPVLCVYSYTDRHEAIDRANRLDVAFQASVFAQDIDIIHDTADRLDASAVMVNDHTAFRVDWMPFAGRRSSGYGIGGIGHTMHDMTHVKMVVYS